MTTTATLDAAGRRRSPATDPDYLGGPIAQEQGASLPSRSAQGRGDHGRAHAVEMAREGVSLNVIQRQLGHANLGITSIYLEGIDAGEIIETVVGARH
jgi:integrase